MKGLITQILICLTLTAGQGFYLTARADSAQTSAPDVVALAQPSAVPMGTCKNAVLEESQLTAVDDQFIPGVAIYSSNFSGDEANRLAKEGVYIGGNSSGNYIDLVGGNMLLNPENDTIISTHSGNIFVGAGAITFIVNSGKDVVVYDLLQTKPKQIYTIANKHKLFMEPGRMLVLSGQDIKDFEKLEIDCHRVAYRNAQPLEVSTQPGKIKVFAADFSIASAMTSIQPLKRLTVSKNREDKVAVERMLRGAVLLGDFATNPESIVSTTRVQADLIQVAADHNQ